MTKHFLHFGAGSNQLPAPWQTLGGNHDIRKPLRFDAESAAAIMAEHVIEHIPYLQALRFFEEVIRVLEPGGCFRVSFPDVSRFVSYAPVPTPAPAPGELSLNLRALLYGEGLEKHLGAALGDAKSKARGAVAMAMVSWGHQSAWSSATCAAALLVAGFSRVEPFEYSQGKYGEFDGHAGAVGRTVAELETSVLEAFK